MRILSLLLLSAVAAGGQMPRLFGGLEAGPHSVGFRSFVVLDTSREYDGKGRPILFDVWYPAAAVPDAPLPYGRYLRVPDVPVHPRFRPRLELHVRKVVADDLFHKKESGLNQDQHAGLSQLFATLTTAHLDAPPLAGPFPTVLYHTGAGGSFEDNSVLFEYLASYGYVVVSSAFESPVPKLVSTNLGGIAISGPDLDFIVQQVHLWTNADAIRLAAIGHSAGAHAVLQWIGSANCPARAFVSLDTTLEYPLGFQANTYLRRELANLTPPRIPGLLVASAWRHPDFGVFDRYLKESPHYEAEAAELTHNDFLTHGYLGRVLMQEANADAVRRSYQEVCRTIRAFLDTVLKDSEAARSLDQPARGSPVSIRHKPAR